LANRREGGFGSGAVLEAPALVAGLDTAPILRHAARSAFIDRICAVSKVPIDAFLFAPETKM
jgi:hypothetical protein